MLACTIDCELIVNGTLELMYCSTNDDIANVLTKAFSQEQLEHLIQRMAIGSPMGH